MIIVVGDVVTDVLAQVGGDDGGLAIGSDTPAAIRTGGGGQGANTAVWLASIDADVTFVGAVGDDRAGEDRAAELRDAGVQTRVRTCAGMATGCVIVLAHGDERTMISDRGANAALDADDVATAVNEASAHASDGAGPRVGHLHLSGYTLLDEASRGTGLRALELAREANLTTSVDAASAAPLRDAGDAFVDWMQGVDILFANRAELQVLSKGWTEGTDTVQKASSALAQRIGGAVVAKLAERGALWSDGEQVVAHDAVPVPVVDTTGAGDAFAAGFLASWTRATRTTVAGALAAGCARGAQAVSRVGAR